MEMPKDQTPTLTIPEAMKIMAANARVRQTDEDLRSATANLVRSFGKLYKYVPKVDPAEVAVYEAWVLSHKTSAEIEEARNAAQDLKPTPAIVSEPTPFSEFAKASPAATAAAKSAFAELSEDEEPRIAAPENF